MANWNHEMFMSFIYCAVYVERKREKKTETNAETKNKPQISYKKLKVSYFSALFILFSFCASQCKNNYKSSIVLNQE